MSQLVQDGLSWKGLCLLHMVSSSYKLPQPCSPKGPSGFQEMEQKQARPLKAQNWPTTSLSPHSRLKQLTGPAQVQGMGKQTLPLDGRSCRGTLQRGTSTKEGVIAAIITKKSTIHGLMLPQKYVTNRGNNFVGIQNRSLFLTFAHIIVFILLVQYKQLFNE